MGLLKEFREFAVKGNVIDLAVGVIIGASFGKIVSSLVEDVVMPPLSLITGQVNFADLNWVLKPAGSHTDSAGKVIADKAVTLNYGNFINAAIQFTILAFVIFLMVKAINKAKTRFDQPPAPGEPIIKECPFCLSEVPIHATKCKFCTSEIVNA